ncbi:UPF0061-domain-containing protein [Thozetella sp. PMI_491]|nr:UPF0061-domain-containing protein [Thozetella sp. PMI_491]
MLFRPVLRCAALARQLRSPRCLSAISAPFSTAPLSMADANGTATTDPAPAAAASMPPSAKGAHLTLAELPKSWHFTASLPPDPELPTPRDSHRTPRDQIGPRQVKGALFSWVRPELQKDPELLGVSAAALRDIGLAPSEAETDEFKQTAVGNILHGWDAESESGPGYPWAQCYGGFQFGSWAGQLGDGRAISLFESTNPETGVRYEVQLKGAGLTPYSRFADGKAVLRSSIREFVVSEALHALRIPTTRALALSLLPHSKVRRETVEPGAIVVRFAQSWLRFGNFDILRARGDRPLIRRLATYIAEDVFGGWETLPARLEDPDKPANQTGEIRRGLPEKELEGPEETQENRFARLYREIVRRNALVVAKWQAYGFMNGVLNTDNTSIFGLSIDFGPFAFLDNFDPAYTPNHDDHALRYSYRNQPTIIWWNLVRLGEALGELLGAGSEVDSESFIKDGVKAEDEERLVSRAEKLIMQAGEEFKAVFLAEYKRLMAARLGLRVLKESDFDSLFSSLLDTMEALELDFNHFFRRLSSTTVGETATEEARHDVAARFFHAEGVTGAGITDEDARKRVGGWLGTWRSRVIEDWGSIEEWGSRVDDRPPITEAAEAERIAAMKAVNPNFVPRGWILDEVIRRVEKEGDRQVLGRVMQMALHPFEDSWAGKTFEGVEYEGDKDEEERWTGDVPRLRRALQCSCSS